MGKLCFWRSRYFVLIVLANRIKSTLLVRNYHRTLELLLRGMPCKANPLVQKAFLENTMEPLIAAAEQGKIHLYYVDAAHFVLGAFLGYLWKRGVGSWALENENWQCYNRKNCYFSSFCYDQVAV